MFQYSHHWSLISYAGLKRLVLVKLLWNRTQEAAIKVRNNLNFWQVFVTDAIAALNVGGHVNILLTHWTASILCV
jgi:hypothetical protein